MQTPLDIDKNINNWARIESTTEIYFIHKPTEKIWVHFTTYGSPDTSCDDNCISHLIVEGKRFIKMDDIRSISQDKIKKIKKEILEEVKKQELEEKDK